MSDSEFWKNVEVYIVHHYYEASITINGVSYDAASFIHEGEYHAKNKLLCQLIGKGIVYED